MRGWLACYAATLVSFLISALGISAAISLSLRRLERSASLLIFGGAVVLVTTALGVLTVTIMWDDWRGLWLVVVAIGVAYTGLRAFARCATATPAWSCCTASPPRSPVPPTPTTSCAAPWSARGS